MLFCIGASFIHAQTFETGKTYTYRSRFNDNGKLSANTIVLSVVFDAKNNATVTRSVEAAKVDDQLASYSPITGISVSNDDNKITISNLPSSGFFVIPFVDTSTEIEPRRTGTDLSIVIRCTCTGVTAHNVEVFSDKWCQAVLNIRSSTYFCNNGSCAGCCDQTTTITASSKSVSTPKSSNLYLSAASVTLINK